MSNDPDIDIPCSDDENYGFNYSETCGEWLPPAAAVTELYEKLDKKQNLTLSWVCPGRRAPQTQDSEQTEEPEEPQVKENKSDFDFLDEFGSVKLGPRRTPGVNRGPRGSAKKKTTSLDGILSSMRRHRKIDELVKAKPAANRPTEK